MLPIKETIQLKTFDSIDIRVGTILEIVPIERSDNLLKFKIDFGEVIREIVSGIKKERSNFQSLVGKQALFLVNLEPKTICGGVSNGMILDLGYSEGIIPSPFIFPEFEVPNGTRLG